MSTAERDKRLDELLAATNSWYEKKEKELSDRVAFVKKVLKGRTGSERLVQATQSAAQSSVIQSIEDFLTGGD